MKVNMVTPWNFVCGNADYAKKLVRELKKWVRVGIIEIERPNIRNPLFFRELAIRANKNCNVIHVQHGYALFGNMGFSGIYGPIFYSSLDKRKMIITTLHDVEDYTKSGWIGKLRVVFRDIIDPFIFNKSNIIHVHSKIARNKLIQRGVDPRKIAVSPLGIFVKPKILSKNLSKKKLGLSGKIVIILLGFVHMNKGYDLAIRAMKKLDKKVVLLIVGKSKNDNYVKSLITLCKKLGVENRVIFYGEFRGDEIPIILSATDVALMPYRKISQSSVLDTVLSYMIPVVANGLDFFKNIEKEYGCLFTFKKNDMRSLCNKLNILIKKPKIIDKSGLEKYLSERSPENITKFLVNLYKGGKNENSYN